MKLTKVSLAALLALGAFSSVASATPLEEAIKNVDFTGFARYRYDNKNEDETTDTKQNGRVTATRTEGEHKAKHNFKFKGSFKAALDDNFFGVLTFNYNNSDNSGDAVKVGHDRTETEKPFNLLEYYAGYKAQNTTITFGKQELGTFFSDDAVGTGLRVVNQDVEGLTLAAVAFDALENDSAESDGDLLKIAKYKLTTKLTVDTNNNNNVNINTLESGYDTGNLYGVAAIGSYDPVSFQLWYASLTNVIDLFALEVAGDFKVSDDISLGLKGQYVNSAPDVDAKEALKSVVNYNKGNFYSLEASTELYGVTGSLAYIGWNVKNTTKNNQSETGTTSFSLEDQGALSTPGYLFDGKYDYTLLSGKGSFFNGELGYKFDQFKVGVEGTFGKVKFAEKDSKAEKYKEFILKGSYAYSKKLKFSTHYAANKITNVDGADTKRSKTDRYRFEAKYSF